MRTTKHTITLEKVNFQIEVEHEPAEPECGWGPTMNLISIQLEGSSQELYHVFDLLGAILKLEEQIFTILSTTTQTFEP